MRRARDASGFTLVEVLVAVVVLGIVSIGAVRLYVTTFGVQHKLARDFDLRQQGLQVLNEIGSGFNLNGVPYGGVHGASGVELAANGTRLELLTDGKAIVYAWNQGAETLIRTIEGAEQVLLNGVENFELSCSDGDKIVRVHLTIVGEGSPRPRSELDASLRPRIAELECN